MTVTGYGVPMTGHSNVAIWPSTTRVLSGGLFRRGGTGKETAKEEQVQNKGVFFSATTLQQLKVISASRRWKVHIVDPPEVRSIPTITPFGFLRRRHRHRRSSQSERFERFELESPHFTHLSGAIGLTKLLDMTSPATRGRHLPKFGKNGRKCCLRRL